MSEIGGCRSKRRRRFTSVEIRPARAEDAAEVAGVHVRSWQVGYKGLLPPAYLEALDPAERAARYRFEDPDPDRPATLVAVEADRIVGFATTGQTGEGGVPGAGELLALYVDPPSWGQGVGRGLIGAARDQLRSRRCSEAVLWVLVGNERAESFYRRDGWSADGTQRRDEVWGITVDEIRYRRSLGDRRRHSGPRSCGV